MPIDRVLETYKILLECPVDSIAAQFNIHAIYITYKYICGLRDKVPTLLVTFHALLTIKTRVSDPFDSNPLANLNRAVDGIFTDGYNLSDTFMATNKGRHRFDRPVAKRSVKICVADTRAVHFHKAFSRCKVIRRLDGMVLNMDLGACIGENGDLLRFWVLRHCRKMRIGFDLPRFL